MYRKEQSLALEKYPINLSHTQETCDYNNSCLQSQTFTNKVSDFIYTCLDLVDRIGQILLY